VISTSQMTLDGWFARLGAVNPAFDAPMRAAYRAMLDPAGTQQPRDLLPAKVLVAQTKAAAT
jgi:hypothetical protein